jgi:hypothetical protein
MRLAYADPPYPGNAETHYGDHEDYAGEVDHEELVARLQHFDGWALSTSSRSLRYVLSLCPEDVRVLIWLNHNVGRSWEPVLVVPARPLPSQGAPRDWIRVEPEAFQWRPTPDGYVIGRKPRAFCLWLFRWLGAIAGEDELEDLYPGSGAVGEAWLEFNAQPELFHERRPPRRYDVRRYQREKPGWLSLEEEEAPPAG